MDCNRHYDKLQLVRHLANHNTFFVGLWRYRCSFSIVKIVKNVDVTIFKGIFQSFIKENNSFNRN